MTSLLSPIFANAYSVIADYQNDILFKQAQLF